MSAASSSSERVRGSVSAQGTSSNGGPDVGSGFSRTFISFPDRKAMRFTRLVPVVALSLMPCRASAQGSPKIHELKASPATVHRGFFDASLKPVLTIDSGDIVRLETASGNPRWYEKLGVPKEKIPAELYAVYEGVEGEGRGDH